MATSKYNIAGLKEAQGELEEAPSLFLECEQICANVLGVDHEETLDAAMRAQTVGEEDKEEKLVADSKYNLALLHKSRRETDKARQLFLECEQTYSAVYGPDHSETQDAARQASKCA